jgi:FKBP-type peptidyl-prolyl cis-trans isomerase
VLLAPWNDKIQYEVIKASDNPLVPKVGENVAIRFRGTFKGAEFDNTLTAEQPYLYRWSAMIMMSMMMSMMIMPFAMIRGGGANHIEHRLSYTA